MKTKEEKLKLIDETIEFYKTNPRCVTFHGWCVYYDESKPYGCAVGRLFKTEDERKKFQTLSLSYGETGVDRMYLNLPDYIQDWGQRFLSKLQRLHDTYVSHISGVDTDFVNEFKSEVENGIL